MGRTVAAGFVLLALAAPGDAAPDPSRRAAAKGCAAEIGSRGAAALLQDCRRVRSDPGACRPDRTCDALREEIRQGCLDAGADGPALCEFHVETDDDEDE